MRSFSLPRLRAVRTFLVLLVIFGLAGFARAEIPPLLKEAFANAKDLDDHWAYTQTTVTEVKFSGNPRRVVTIVRFDPSKPYAEQYQPVLVKGHAPTSKDFEEYREKGEKRQE